jgi:hypothetical protein
MILHYTTVEGKEKKTGKKRRRNNTQRKSAENTKLHSEGDPEKPKDQDHLEESEYG